MANHRNLDILADYQLDTHDKSSISEILDPYMIIFLTFLGCSHPCSRQTRLSVHDILFIFTYISIYLNAILHLFLNYKTKNKTQYCFAETRKSLKIMCYLRPEHVSGAKIGWAAAERKRDLLKAVERERSVERRQMSLTSAHQKSDMTIDCQPR